VIFDVIVTVLFAVLSAVFGLIPEFDSFSPGWLDGMVGGGASGTFFDRIGGILLTLDLFVPMGLLFQVLGIILLTKVFVAGVQFVTFIWDKLPFKSS
jgi:hypothetical protein